MHARPTTISASNATMTGLGPTIYHNDDRRNECFRKYNRPEDSFYDHSDFLKSGSRYSFLFDLSIADYKAWARGLKKAGYATNPDYADMLIRKIEEHNLNSFDKGFIKAEKTAATITPMPEAARPVVNEFVNTATVNTER